MGHDFHSKRSSEIYPFAVHNTNAVDQGGMAGTEAESGGELTLCPDASHKPQPYELIIGLT